MTITPQELISTIETKNGFPFDQAQLDAINHGQGPLWLIAGPGTGKTETLVVRTAKLICCDGVDSGSILVTTFTEKAARSLEERLWDVVLYLQTQYPQQLTHIDISRVRMGTLHGLCNDIMQEFRYPPYQNLRLMDEVESQMLIRDNLAWRFFQQGTQLQQAFNYLFFRPNPSLWDWTKALQKLFNRIVEDQIDLAQLQLVGGAWAELATAYLEYRQLLSNRFSSDFSHLQKYFLEFLNSNQGSLFLNGDDTTQRPPLQYFLVDEYQDSNPIQEDIYFSLADRAPYNLTVVGDDDQALYRFRGGTVECMLSFPAQCQNRWQVNAREIQLQDNHRSDERIVDFCNDYITSFPVMNRIRAPNKQLNAHLGVRGNYPAVSHIRANNVANVANTFAEAVRDLCTNSIINDFSQCVLLMRSTRDSPRNAGPFIAALRSLNIPIYNPRSKSYLEQDEIKEALGALVTILDPNLSGLSRRLQVYQMVTTWMQQLQTVLPNYPGLQNYINLSQHSIQQKGTDERITTAFPSILYRILAHDPFLTYQTDPEQDLRLSKLTRLLESFCSQYGRSLYTDNNQPGMVKLNWLGKFYNIFFGYLFNHGLDDDEDDEVICPPGRLPIMTIHQSKGLEFDFVFVDTLGRSVTPSDSIYLENAMRPYRSRLSQIIINTDDASWQDEIRMHFVAYSRAKYALILLGTDGQFRKRGDQTASFGQQGGQWARQITTRL